MALVSSQLRRTLRAPILRDLVRKVRFVETEPSVALGGPYFANPFTLPNARNGRFCSLALFRSRGASSSAA
jgi:hypothetical protein